MITVKLHMMPDRLYTVLENVLFDQVKNRHTAHDSADVCHLAAVCRELQSAAAKEESCSWSKADSATAADSVQGAAVVGEKAKLELKEEEMSIQRVKMLKSGIFQAEDGLWCVWVSNLEELV